MPKVKLTPYQIIQLKQEGTSQKAMARIWEVTQQTIIRWKNWKPTVLQKRGCKSKTNEDDFELLKSYVFNNNTKTQQEMADYIFQQTGISISQQTISRILRKKGISYKKLTYHYNQLDEEKAKAFNEEIKPLLTEYPFIALDECSFYPNLDPRFGYSLKGTRAVSKRPSHKGKHYTLLFAISNLRKNGIIHWKLVEKSVDWEVFYNFLEEINPIGDKRSYLIMDNAKIHTAPDKREKAKLPSVEEQMLRKNIEVRLITPYAPMLNPTELAFCLLRQQTERGRTRNYGEMKLAIEKVVELLNQKDLSEYFRHCVEYFNKKDTSKEKKAKMDYNGESNGKQKQIGLLPRKRENIK